MKSKNAKLILKLKSETKRLFRFKSPISHEILLYICSNEGACELRSLFKNLDATAIAIRQHVQTLEIENYILLKINTRNKRSKIIQLTPKGIKLMVEYEMKINRLMTVWNKIDDIS